MSHKVELTPKAEKYLKSMPKKFARQIIGKLELLGENPRPRGCKKIKADKERFRIHSGNYRIIYEVHDDILLVLVIRIDVTEEVSVDHILTMGFGHLHQQRVNTDRAQPALSPFGVD